MVRGRLPHAIEATAILTEALLHDVPETSQLNVRLAYSTAICRYVYPQEPNKQREIKEEKNRRLTRERIKLGS